jgi:Tfp pilus assembly protein PilF
VAFASRWDEATAAEVEPYYRDTLAFDRHRLAEIRAQIAGVPYETDDQDWWARKALEGAFAQDPELMRTFVSMASLLERDGEVLARPGLAERALAYGPPGPAPGPTRAELLAVVGA